MNKATKCSHVQSSLIVLPSVVVVYRIVQISSLQTRKYRKHDTVSHVAPSWSASRSSQVCRSRRVGSRLSQVLLLSLWSGYSLDMHSSCIRMSVHNCDVTESWISRLLFYNVDCLR